MRMSLKRFRNLQRSDNLKTNKDVDFVSLHKTKFPKTFDYLSSNANGQIEKREIKSNKPLPGNWRLSGEAPIPCHHHEPSLKHRSFWW